jgi:hypothetical protein
LLVVEVSMLALAGARFFSGAEPEGRLDADKIS